MCACVVLRADTCASSECISQPNSSCARSTELDTHIDISLPVEMKETYVVCNRGVQDLLNDDVMYTSHV